MPQHVLTTTEVSTLVTRVEEATRSTDEGVKYFIEPAPGTRTRASSKRHHIVFGRRGSGKSSLLRKVVADAAQDRRPVVYVDMEEFKGHSYPDVLVSVLICTLTEIRNWLNTAAVFPASKTTFWAKLRGSKPAVPPHDQKASRELVARVEAALHVLQQMLHAADASEFKAKSLFSFTESNSESARTGAKLGPPGLSADASIAQTAQDSSTEKFEITESYKASKEQFLHRSIIELKDLLASIGRFSSGHGFILLDDLYHIRLADQANVIDYFHRICKNTNIWLKVGTVRYRTRYYMPGDPPRGMKVGDDCDQIDLDVTLEKYQITKTFLMNVLDQFAREAGVELGTILADGARDRLVLASGGVARDFLSLFRRSVAVAVGEGRPVAG